MTSGTNATVKRRFDGRIRRLAAGVGGAALALTLVTAPVAGAISVEGVRPSTSSLPRCQTSGLVVWLDPTGNGAAGSFYDNLRFTNLSGSFCELTGFPGVSAVGLTGAQVGLAARRSLPSAVVSVRLAPGATSTSVIQLADVATSPQARATR